MDSLNRKVIVGLAVTAAVTAALFAYMSAAQEKIEPLSDYVVEGCRDLVRESAGILVEVAQDDLNYDDPDDASRLSDLTVRISEIEDEMAVLNCRETQDGWAYGSFKQEMSEYEAYIAELVRGNAQP